MEIFLPHCSKMYPYSKCLTFISLLLVLSTTFAGESTSFDINEIYTDVDNDGVPDSADIDNDNDGIIDT
ncbi:MAG: hypothetical protein WBN11_03450, partial [Eudoraea sp.]|uniref:hypothetical protein n=1 Tax=Eudoraea sp. TaxID=1979955 RepID=UPI003C73B238